MNATRRPAMAVSLMVAGLVSGCSTLDAWRFKPAAESGQGAGELRVQLVDQSLKPTRAARDGAKPLGVGLPQAKAEVDAFTQALLAHCGPGATTGSSDKAQAEVKTSAAGIPVLAALVSSAFNIFADRRARAIEGIVESAQATYSTRLLITPRDLQQATCIVLTRAPAKAPEPDKTAGMVAILKLTAPAAAPAAASAAAATQIFSLQPVYLRLHDLVAVTQQPEKAEPPRANLSFGIAIKAVSPQRDGVGRLVAVGEGVASAAGVGIGKDGTAACTDGSCAGSDLITYPAGAPVLSLTLAVVEQGSTGFDDKAALAELAALKAALGPAIDEAVRERLGKD